MTTKIKISEEDLFYFVFDKLKLSKEKVDFIENQKEYYKNEIDLLLSIKYLDLNSIKTENSIFDNIKLLLPQNNYSKEHSVPLHLAAASVELRKHDIAHSYTDSKNEYLIRIIEQVDRDLLYLLTEKSLPNNVRIQIFPSGKEYFIKNNIQPIEILKEKTIEKIIIQ